VFASDITASATAAMATLAGVGGGVAADANEGMSIVYTDNSKTEKKWHREI
jgi:hypothetical protein